MEQLEVRACRVIEHGSSLLDVRGQPWPNGRREVVFPMEEFLSVEVRATWRLGPHEVMSFGLEGRMDNRDPGSWGNIADCAMVSAGGTAPGVFRKNGSLILRVSLYMYEARVVLFKRFGNGKAPNDIWVSIARSVKP